MSEENKNNSLEMFIKNIKGTITRENLNHWGDIFNLQNSLGSKYEPKGWFSMKCPNCKTPLQYKELGHGIVRIEGEYGSHYSVRRKYGMYNCPNCNYEYADWSNLPL